MAEGILEIAQCDRRIGPVVRRFSGKVVHRPGFLQYAENAIGVVPAVLPVIQHGEFEMRMGRQFMLRPLRQKVFKKCNRCKGLESKVLVDCFVVRGAGGQIVVVAVPDFCEPFGSPLVYALEIVIPPKAIDRTPLVGAPGIAVEEAPVVDDCLLAVAQLIEGFRLQEERTFPPGFVQAADPPFDFGQYPIVIAEFIVHFGQRQPDISYMRRFRIARGKNFEGFGGLVVAPHPDPGISACIQGDGGVLGFPVLVCGLLKILEGLLVPAKIPGRGAHAVQGFCCNARLRIVVEQVREYDKRLIVSLAQVEEITQSQTGFRGKRMPGVLCFQSFEEGDRFVVKPEGQLRFGFIIQGVDRMEMIGMIPPEAGKGLDCLAVQMRRV